MNRVCVFIDGSNLYHALKRNDKPTRVDHYELSKLLVRDRVLIRTYYYNAIFDAENYPERAKSQQSFFDTLERTPYLEVRLGRLIMSRGGGHMEKGVDVRMAVDMLFYASQNFYDTAVVVTEDQDFVPAILSVKEMGKHVEVAVFNDATAKEMVRVSDKLVLLNEVLKTPCIAFPPGPDNSELLGVNGL